MAGKQGFASMDPKLVKELASKGGKAAHAQGTAHKYTTEEARSAGRIGGARKHKRNAEQVKGNRK